MNVIQPDALAQILGGNPAEVAAQVDRLVASLQKLRVHMGTLMGETRPETVVSIVASQTGVSIEDILGRRRPERIVWPRHIAAWCLVEVLSLTLEQAGAALGGRDHGTAHNSKELVWQRMETDRKFRAQVESIRDLVKASGSPIGSTN